MHLRCWLLLYTAYAPKNTRLPQRLANPCTKALPVYECTAILRLLVLHATAAIALSSAIVEAAIRAPTASATTTAAGIATTAATEAPCSSTTTSLTATTRVVTTPRSSVTVAGRFVAPGALRSLASLLRLTRSILSRPKGREVVVAGVFAQDFFVDVEDRVHTGVTLDVAGHRPALGEIGVDYLGELFAGVIRMPARAGYHADRADGVGVEVRKRQVDVADPR